MSTVMLRRGLAALGMSMAAAACQATEGNGLGIYPDGLENFLSGALPPPGVHVLAYAGGGQYDKLRDNDGKHIGPPDFKVKFGAVVPRVVWVTPHTLLGGQLAFEALAPLMSVDVRAGGQTFSKTGVGDLVLGAVLGYHHSAALHSAFGFDVYAPTGQYDRNNPASLGRNVWAFQPVAAVSYAQPVGLNADVKAMWDIPRRNDDTQTRSGQALHADYAMGWGLGNGWVVGVGGHVYRQITDDKGPNAGTGKASSLAIGPSLRYANEKGLMITVKFQREFHVRNRPEGQQLWVKASLPF